jgi:hypothetical protein
VVAGGGLGAPGNNGAGVWLWRWRVDEWRGEAGTEGDGRSDILGWIQWAMAYGQTEEMIRFQMPF